MTFVYPADSGQDYGIIARSNGMKVRIVADGAGWKAVPNPGWRPRSVDEIAAIHATAA
jgi:glucose-6-phosphate isomerase